MNIQDYLKGNRYTEIRVGQSGADVWEINGTAILKYVERRKLEGPLFDTYAREALFYRSRADAPRGYLPEVLDLEISDDEIVLLLKKYESPERGSLDESLIRKITRALASVHADSIPEFMNADRKTAAPLSGQQIEECLSGWKSVQAEHPELPDDAPLDTVAEKINRIIAWHDSEERVLVHGDFHWDNLLTDSSGNVLICDWQSVGLGGASGDLSFFLSRLGSDGVRPDPDLFLRAYSEAAEEITGRPVNAEALAGHMAAANVITSFVFWHLYLHGADAERVRGIYGRMAEDYRAWNRAAEICGG